MKNPLLIAHRGDIKNYPENTIEAFESALNKGADGIEFDVQINEKGVPIIVHNYSYDKSVKYPLLSKVLAKFAGKCRIELEVKSLETEAIEKISKIVDRYRPLDLEVASSVLPLFHTLAKYFPNDKRGLIFRKWLIEDWMTDDFKIYWIVQHLKLTQATVLHLDLELYFEGLVEELHKENFTVHTHIKEGSRSVLDLVKNLKIDQCTFDDIEIVKLRN